MTGARASGLDDRRQTHLAQTTKALPMTQTDMNSERDTLRATWKGFCGRCPNCGSGPLMKGFLQVRDHCPECQEPFHYHRADDGPAYLTILIVGHLMAPLLLAVYTAFRPEPMMLFLGFLVGTVGLSLFLLPRFKGGLVAFQWARYMHGFESGRAT